MSQQFIIEANITRSHKDKLGFEYETRIINGTLPWGRGIPVYTSSKLPEPKTFSNEVSAWDYVKNLKRYSETDKALTVIGYSINVK
tara:strand:+ start:224 stop:481 length:258 start_codon:yes stop_codon:yes gene_type:complete